MKKIFLFLIVVIILVLLLLVYNINEKRILQKHVNVYDTVNNILSTTIDNEKNTLLSLSIALSKSRAIQDVILDNNKTLGHRVLSASAKALNSGTDMENVSIQIITKNLSVFAKSWEENKSDIPMVTGRRTSLKKLLLNFSPKTGIDLGLPLGIRSSSIIFYKDDSLGILEAITPYDVIVNNLRKYQIEVIPLIHKNFAPMVYVDKEELVTVGSFVVANHNINRESILGLNDLSDDELNTFFQNDFLFKNNLLYASYPILSVDGNKLGIFLALIDKNNFENFIGEQKSIIQSIYSLDSSRDDIYHFAQKREESIFAKMRVEYISALGYRIDKNDRADFEEFAKYKLNQLTKEELVDLIFYRYTKKEIRGEIK